MPVSKRKTRRAAQRLRRSSARFGSMSTRWLTAEATDRLDKTKREIAWRYDGQIAGLQYPFNGASERGSLEAARRQEIARAAADAVKTAREEQAAKGTVVVAHQRRPKYSAGCRNVVAGVTGAGVGAGSLFGGGTVAATVWQHATWWLGVLAGAGGFLVAAVVALFAYVFVTDRLDQPAAGTYEVAEGIATHLVAANDTLSHVVQEIPDEFAHLFNTVDDMRAEIVALLTLAVEATRGSEAEQLLVAQSKQLSEHAVELRLLVTKHRDEQARLAAAQREREAILVSGYRTKLSSSLDIARQRTRAVTFEADTAEAVVAALKTQPVNLSSYAA